MFTCNSNTLPRVRPAPAQQVARRLAWLAATLLALFTAGWLMPTPAQAGTITIVDGPNTPPVDGLYTDGYIQTQLAAGNLTIDTSAGSGPDEIRVLQSAVITWTTGRTLTLDAGTNVVISGTIQHDGPANGAGGLRLLAPAGTVFVGTGDQTAGVAAGSRHGLTRVQATTLVLQGGGTDSAYAQLGFHAVNKGAAYAVTGSISVTVSQNVTATGGIGFHAFVQIGHGGAEPFLNDTVSGSLNGVIAVVAGGDVTFQGDVGYAQLGNGGFDADGNHSGGHSLNAGGDVTFQSAQLGNGGALAAGDHSGGHTLTAGGDVTFQSAQLGNSGYGADGNGNHSGGHTLNAGGNVTFQGEGFLEPAQMGNSGYGADGNDSGDHHLTADGDVIFQGGMSAGSYAQFGNRGNSEDGELSGAHNLTAGGDVTFQGGGGNFASAQFGQGGAGAATNLSGSLALTSTGRLTVTAGSGEDAYAMIGHGSDLRINLDNQSTGSRAGDIRLRVGETAVFSGSHVGHLTASGVLSVTQGNTYLGVSQNDPFASGSGQLLVTGVQTTSFTSAPTANDGELRFYLPREESQQIPLNATFNGDTFTTANTIPPAQLAGVALFGEGSYIPNYSFYLGGEIDAAVTKTVTPTEPVQPEGTLTYTIGFSNTGTLTATGVVISDSLPSVLTGTVVTLSPDSGVVITETSAAPDLVWSVSDLVPGQGGTIQLVVTVQETAEAGSIITNTVTISATGDIDAQNNTASVTSEVATDESGNVYLPVLQR